MNFGAPVVFEEDSYPVPLRFRLGGAVDVIGSGGLITFHDANRLTATFDLIQPNDYDQQWAAGLEYAFLQRIHVRGGYQHNYDVASYSFGLGIRQPIASVGLGFDYSYSSMSEAFGVVHRLGFHFR